MKFKKEEIWQVKRNMFKGKSWLKVKQKKKDLKCVSCGVGYTEDSKIALLTFKSGSGKSNAHLCDKCAQEYIAMGAIDIRQNQKDLKTQKDALIKEILDGYAYIDSSESFLKRKKVFLGKFQIEELGKEKAQVEELCVKFDKIQQVDTSTWDKLEDYLLEQYHIIQDKKYLKTVDQIYDYFSEDIMDYFDCGQGYYEDVHEVLVYIANKFYKVTIYAEIMSAKQDRGDRLYWVDYISDVKYVEIEKPVEKLKETFRYEITMTDSEKIRMDTYMNDNEMFYTVSKV